MDYEKKYKEAIKKAKKDLEVCEQDCLVAKQIFRYFPELAESEDEKIRKEMIFYFNKEMPQCSIQEHSDKMREFISWLKRQEVECTKLELKAGNSYFCYKSRWERADSETFKKGLIYKCNKDGVLDNFVIKNPEQHFIEIKDERIAWLEKQGEKSPSIIWHDINEEPEEMKELFCEWESDDATWHDVAFYDKESKTFRHAKMPINVTKWVYVDELLKKQGEQKPADKVEPFNKYEGPTDFERTLADICIGWIGEELGWKQYIKDNADVLLKIAIEKFNSVQDVPFEQNPAWNEKQCNPTDEDMKEALRTEYEKGRADAIANMQKEWSDKEKQMYADIIEATKKSGVFKEAYKRELVDWPKSLRPQNWTKEDKKRYISCLQRLSTGNPEQPETINSKWFKEHVYPQNHWKPSDEQLRALDSTAGIVGILTPTGVTLCSLYHDLKKLTE